MNAERRRWRCSSCQREYQIPLAADDPMACRECVGPQHWTPAWQPIPLADTDVEADPAIPPSPHLPAAADPWDDPLWGTEPPGSDGPAAAYAVGSQGAWEHHSATPAATGAVVGSPEAAAIGRSARYETRKAAVDQREPLAAEAAARPSAARSGGAARTATTVAAALVVAGLLIGGLLVWQGLDDRSPGSTAAPAVGDTGTAATAGKPAAEKMLVAPPTARCNPDSDAPLVALVDFQTDRPTVASLAIDDGQRRWTYRPIFAATREHHLAIVGLRPGRQHTIRVQVETPDALATDVSEPIELTTPPLPDDFPPLQTLLSRPEKMEPGVTLFAANIWRNNERIYDYGYFIAVDAAGEVVWFYRTGKRSADLRVLSNGHLLYNEAKNFGMFEVDLLGNPIRQWWAANLISPPTDRFIPVETDSFHHHVGELPNGNLLTLSTELRMTEEFPSSEIAPFGASSTAAVVGDVVLEFARDGTVVDRLPLYDLLDPRRIGYGSLSAFWASHYPAEEAEEGSRDWSHANAIVYDPATDGLIVSLRHQDCLVKIDRQSRQIVWILGDPSGWRYPWRNLLLQPRGALQWFYHQHGPELTPFGTLLMYDNGNYRAIPPEPKRPAPDNYSRVVEFAIDEATQSVTQQWEYGGGPHDEHFYSTFYGEADRMPVTGNVLITDGGRIETADGKASDEIPSDHQWARILEVTHDYPAEKLFEMRMDSGMDSGVGWSMYRSERLHDLSRLSNMATAARAAQIAAQQAAAEGPAH